MSRYYQMMPTLSGLASMAIPSWLSRASSGLWFANSLLESLWPVNRLSSNLFLVARKRLVISAHYPERAA
jgi:hypothetical protein